MIYHDTTIILRRLTDMHRIGFRKVRRCTSPRSVRSGENEYGKRNWAVEYFNNQLNNRLDARIGRLNLYVFLTGSGYTTQADGLHYDGATYAAMFRFLMQSIGRI